MKAYLLVFEASEVDRKVVKAVIDTLPEIQNWHAFFGNTMCLAADIGAKRLARRINEALPQLTYILTEVQPDHKGGRIPRSVLSFLNEPQPVQAETS
jgi:hypothetical protein